MVWFKILSGSKSSCVLVDSYGISVWHDSRSIEGPVIPCGMRLILKKCLGTYEVWK